MPKHKPEKILVVDDDAAHRFMLKTMLHKWGWRAEEAADGTTAVDAVLASPPLINQSESFRQTW